MINRLAGLVEELSRQTESAELDVRIFREQCEIELQLARRQLEERDDVFLTQHNPGAEIARRCGLGWRGRAA